MDDTLDLLDFTEPEKTLEYLMSSCFGKKLSGSILYEIADILFYGLSSEMYLAELGIRFSCEKMKTITKQYPGYKYRTVRNAEIYKFASFDFDLPENERKIIVEQIRILFDYQISGLNDFRNLKQQLFIIFVIVQRRTGNSNGVLKLLEIMFSEIKHRQPGSPIYITHHEVISNTLHHHFSQEKKRDPLIWPVDERLQIKTVMKAIK